MRTRLSWPQKLLLLLTLALCLGPRGSAAGAGRDEVCGSYPGRILTELALHRQYVTQRVRSGIAPLALPSSPPALDNGNIAIIPDDGTLVLPANAFDLDLKGLTFQPAGAGYSVAAGSSVFDADAGNNGFLLNPGPAGNPDNIGDDGTREVAIGFPFPYFGKPYTMVFINSDGNLTFLQGDSASSERSLSRFLAGPPRIAPYFADLNPSAGGRLTVFSSSSRFVVTWSQVPDFSDSGVGPQESFQVTLTPDGRVQFAYSGIRGREAIVGVSPGNFTGLPNLADLSRSTGERFDGPVAEVFTASTQLDMAAATQRFYQTHEDAYDFLVMFTNFDFDLSGAFAFEINVSNQVTGIGHLSSPPIFDFSAEFGSSRLQSLLNMGNLSRYPANPSTVFLRGVDSTLSIMGQEAGHRFLSYVTFNDPEGSHDSNALLGRDLQHWSFLFNSDASVDEGNRIRDNGDGTFTTTGVVEHYSDLDQYLMGLRSPQEVSPTFLVKDPGILISPARAPALNVTIPGRRANVLLDQIISSNGPRLPNSVISQKNFNFGFILVVPKGQSPSLNDVAHLEAIRTAWEGFYNRATDFRGVARTTLLRGLRFAPSPLGLFSGNQSQGRLELLSPTTAEVTVNLTNSNPSAVTLPSSVVIAAGAKSSSFPIAGLSPGRALVSASASSFESGSTVIEVLPGASVTNLSLTATSGNLQTALAGSPLPRPLQVTLQDSNQIPYTGARVEFAVTQGVASLNPSGATTDGQGNASTGVVLGEGIGTVTVIATVPGSPLNAKFSILSVGPVQVPGTGTVNGAGFVNAPAALAPGSIISIFGTSLSSSIALAQSLPLPTTLANASVEIGGLRAPLFYVSPAQINAQVPFELPIGPSAPAPSLLVRNGVSSSTPVPLSVGAVGPGIFSRDSSGRGPAVITHSSTQLLVTGESPATAGEFVQIFATGLGAVTPAVPSGRPAPLSPLSPTSLLVTVTMNGVPATVSFAGLSPGLVGLYQVNAQVPQGMSGTVEVVVHVNGVASNAVTMEVR